MPLDCQTGVVVALFKKGNRRFHSKYKDITLLGLPGMNNNQTSDLMAPSWPWNTRPIFILARVLEEAWEFVHPVYLCLVDLEKTFDHIPHGTLWMELHEYNIGDHYFGSYSSYTKMCESGLHCWQ